MIPRTCLDSPDALVELADVDMSETIDRHAAHETQLGRRRRHTVVGGRPAPCHRSDDLIGDVLTACTVNEPVGTGRHAPDPEVVAVRNEEVSLEVESEIPGLRELRVEGRAAVARESSNASPGDL